MVSASAKIFPHYTYAEWEKWEGQWELIEGIPYAMAPMAVPKHQRISAALRAEFIFALKKCDKCTAYDPVDYRVADDTILQPDILVVSGGITKKYLDFPLSLVVEVLSPFTALIDRHTKYYLYEQQQVKYYLIVDIDPECIEIYEHIDGAYQLVQQGRDFSHDFSFGSCSATIHFKEIW